MKKNQTIKVLLAAVLSCSIIAGVTNSFAENTVEPIIHLENKKLEGNLANATAQSTDINTPENLTKVKSAMKSGSITLRFKFNNKVNPNPGTEVNGLLSASTKGDSNAHAVLAVMRRDNGVDEVVFEQRSASGIANVVDSNIKLEKGTLNNTNWHTLTYTFKETDTTNSNMTVYLDGQNVGNINVDYTHFNKVKDGFNIVTLGGVEQANQSLKYPMNGSMDIVQIHDQVITDDQIKELHTSTDVVELPEMTKLWKKGTKINSGEAGDDPDGVAVSMYRIPSIVKTDSGKLIAAADARKYHYNDWGDIATAVRISEDDGKTWGENKVVVDMPTNSNFDKSEDFIKDGYYPNSKRTQSAVAIDPVLLHADGKTYLFVDICPESNGAIDATSTSAYEKIKGKYYLNLYDKSNKKYTVRDQGVVYDGVGNKTDYVVDGYNAETLTSTSNGELLKSGKSAGNIYLNGSGNKSGELHVLKTGFIWLFTSEDDGETWSLPRDLTPFVKEDYMKFIGTGPGAGIKAKKADGSTRLIFPIYYTTNGVGTNLGSQSSACIYSDDGGKTWIRGESPNDGRIVNKGTDEERTITSQTLNNQKGDSTYELTESQIVQLNDGRLVQFMRNTSFLDADRDYGVVQYAISKDYGETWGQVYDTDIREPYCQLSAISVKADLDGKGIKEYIAISNASGNEYSTKTLPHDTKKSRKVGHIRLCEIKGDELNVKYDKTIDDGGFAYSSLVQIDDNHLGIVYEKEGYIMQYMKVNFDYLTDNKVNVFSPKVKSIKIDNENKVVQANDELAIKVTFDQTVFMVNGQTRQLDLKINGTNATAEYVSGSGTNELIFKYVVKDNDSGEIAVSIENDAIIDTVYGQSFDKDKNNNKLYTVAYIGNNQADKTKDIPLVNAGGSAAIKSTKALNALDDDSLSYWTTNVNGAYFIANLKGPSTVDGIRYLPRQGDDEGRITSYEVYVSSDGNTYNQVATGTWMASDGWKSISFDEQQNIKNVKLVIKGAAKPSTTAQQNAVASIAEMRVTGTSTFIKDNLDAEITSRYSTVRLNWNDVASAEQYVISASDQENGTYEVIKTIRASQNQNEFIYECGYGKDYYYKVTAKNNDGILDEQILHDTQVSFDGLKNNSIINKMFEEENQTFDGQRVETLQDSDINSDNHSLQDLKLMKTGSIIVKFKRSSTDSGNSALFGINTATSDLKGNSSYASLAIKDDNTLRVVYGKNGSQAGFTPVLSRDEWHTLVLSIDPSSYCLTVDGQEVKLSNTNSYEMFSQITSSINSVSIGGQNGITNFKGEIEYVLVTQEILTSQEAIDLTTGYTEAVNKDELIKAIQSTKTINLQEYTNSSVSKYVKALEKANMMNEAARPSQEEVDKATKNLMIAIEELVKIAYENNTVNITPVTIEDEVNKVVVGFKDLEEAEKVLKNDAMALDIVKKELKKGSYVEVVAESSALPVSDLSTTDKTQLNKYLKDIEKDEDTEIGQYLDVSLAVYAKDSQNTSEKREIARLDETSLLLDFEIDLDEKFNDRGVTIYRLHENDDGSKTIDTLYTTKENGKVIFESHLFSEFIMVVDKEKTPEVKPGDSTKPDGNKPDGSENPDKDKTEDSKDTNTDNSTNQDDKTSSSVLENQVNTSGQTRSIELLLGCMGIAAVVYFIINKKKEETK